MDKYVKHLELIKKNKEHLISSFAKLPMDLTEKKYTIANKRLVFRNIHFAGSDSIFILTTVDYSTWYILKTDTSGNIIKQVEFNSPPTINDPWFNDFIVEDNSIILVTYFPIR